MWMVGVDERSMDGGVGGADQEEVDGEEEEEKQRKGRSEER